jgi:hypothetical protein
MNYCLQANVVGSVGKITLTEEEFTAIKNAKRTLGLLFNLTENYRVVVESYRAVEAAKHEAELSSILHSKTGYDDMSETRVLLSSPISGYLTSSRYFLDTTPKLLGGLIGSDELEAFKKFCNEIYDSTPEYRFVEALRNYSQHRELPIHKVTYHHFVENVKDFEGSPFVTALSLGAAKELLAGDPKFKKPALEGMPDTIDIIQCIRFHMEGLWQLHDYLMKKLNALAEQSRAVVAESISRFEQLTGENAIGLHAFAEMSDIDVREEIPLLLDWDNARRLAVKRLGNLENLHRRYITGRIQTEK